MKTYSVYMAQFGDDLFKIGQTFHSPQRRVKQIETTNPYGEKLECKRFKFVECQNEEVALMLERCLKVRLHPFRDKNLEWFRLGNRSV